MILVTGGTGLVGAHLLLHLTENESVVRAIFRSEKSKAKTKNLFQLFQKEHLFDRIIWVKADILNIPALNNAMQDITHVYHCAALVSFDTKDEEALRKTNIEGTANVVNCALEAQVKKICYVSSIAALGNPILPETLITETTDWNPEKSHSDYAITKYGGEMEVWRGSYEGLSCIIVNPGVILGAGFWDTGSGEIFSRVAQGLSFYSEGTTGFVSVKDVVQVMTQLMNTTISEEKFIVISENVDYKTFLFSLADALGVKKPYIKATPLMTSLTWKLDWLLSKVFLKKSLFPKSLAKSLHSNEVFSNEKIKSCLNFSFEPIQESLSSIANLYSKRN
jgi:dihydroflavonol-4-reductase